MFLASGIFHIIGNTSATFLTNQFYYHLNYKQCMHFLKVFKTTYISPACQIPSQAAFSIKDL